MPRESPALWSVFAFVFLGGGFRSQWVYVDQLNLSDPCSGGGVFTGGLLQEGMLQRSCFQQAGQEWHSWGGGGRG